MQGTWRTTTGGGGWSPASIGNGLFLVIVTVAAWYFAGALAQAVGSILWPVLIAATTGIVVACAFTGWLIYRNLRHGHIPGVKPIPHMYRHLASPERVKQVESGSHVEQHWHLHIQNSPEMSQYHPTNLDIKEDI